MLRKSYCLLGFALVVGLSFGFVARSKAQDRANETFVDSAKAGAEFAIQGEYVGPAGNSMFGLQLVTVGEDTYEGLLYAKGLPGATWDGKTRLSLTAKQTKDGLTFSGLNLKGTIAEGVAKGELDGVKFELKKTERTSPTLGAKPPEKAIVLFDGTNVDAWEKGKHVDDKYLGVGTRTKRRFKDYTLHVEFRTPYMPFARGQARGNSGLYLNDQYEFQILDSFGLSGENNECGGYYSFAKPAVNMCLPPLSWQTYDVEFTMARFDSEGKKTKSAIATVRLNGVVIHENYEIPKSNGGGGLNDESQPGSIYFQDHGNPVHFRNIWIVEK